MNLTQSGLDLVNRLSEKELADLSKAMEDLFGQKELESLQKEMERLLDDEELMQELEKQLDQLFEPEREQEGKEPKRGYEPPEGEELDREIERMLDLLRKRFAEEREKTARPEDAEEKMEELLDEELGKRKEEPVPAEGGPHVGIRVSIPEDALRYQLGISGGLLIDEVKPDSPAKRAGLKPGDVVITVNGKEVASFNDMAAALEGKLPGDKLTMEVIVRGKRTKIELILGAR